MNDDRLSEIKELLPFVAAKNVAEDVARTAERERDEALADASKQDLSELGETLVNLGLREVSAGIALGEVSILLARTRRASVLIEREAWPAP